MTGVFRSHDLAYWAVAGPDMDIPASDLFGVSAALTVPAPTRVTSPLSPLTINLDWDSSVSSAPTGFMTTIVAAARYLETRFSDAVTITLNVGYGEVAGFAMSSGVLGDSLANMATVLYTSL